MNTDTLEVAAEARGIWELEPVADDRTGGPTAIRAAQGDGYLTETQAVDRLDELKDAIARREDAQRQVVTLLGDLVRSGRIEQLEGLTPELLLKLKHAQSGLDCWLVLTAVEVLARMPATARLYGDGALSWSQVCQIVSRVRRLSVEAMGIIDRRIDASADLLDALGPDGLEAAVDSAVREAQGPERATKDEDRARTDGFVHLQPKLFGGIKLYGEYDDPLEAATIVNGLDAAARHAHRTAHATDDIDGEVDRHDMPDRWNGGTRSFWQGRGLLGMCEHALAGHAAGHSCDDHGDQGDAPGHVGPRRGKPTAIVHIDVADTTTTCAGQVELNVTGGGLPDITRQRLEQILTDDHDLRVVLFDDGRPLAVSDLIHADQIPTKTRIAVRARDRGCRFDGRTPAGRAHQHHLDGRANGHHPDRSHELGVIRSDGARASRRRRRCDGATRRKRDGEGAPPEYRMIPGDTLGNTPQTHRPRRRPRRRRRRLTGDHHPRPSLTPHPDRSHAALGVAVGPGG